MQQFHYIHIHQHDRGSCILQSDKKTLSISNKTEMHSQNGPKIIMDFFVMFDIIIELPMKTGGGIVDKLIFSSSTVRVALNTNLT